MVCIRSICGSEGTDARLSRTDVGGLSCGRALMVVASSNALGEPEHGPAGEDVPAEHPARRGLGATSLNVMTFNIWLGGGLVDFSKVVEAIQKSDADAVGLQEAAGHTQEIADRLGWYAEPRLHVISRFPIISPPQARAPTSTCRSPPGRSWRWPTSTCRRTRTGRELVRDGSTLAEVLANEQDTRMSALDPLLPVWKKVIDSGMPLFVTGDFNSPSHLDWTPATVGALPQMKYPVAWPAGLAVEGIGMVDTFRAAHPDPVVDPGSHLDLRLPVPRGSSRTRSSTASTSSTPRPGSTVTKSRVVGQPGTPDVDVAVDPYPSDHRSVVSTVVVTPAEPPLFVSVEQVRVERGDPFGVRYHAPKGEDTDRLVVVRAGRSAAHGAGIMWLPPMEASYYGQVLFGSGNLSPGAYDVVLLTTHDREVSRSRFWVVAAG